MPGPPETERPRQRTPAEIEQELAETTQRLASKVDALVDRLNPRHVARRGIAGLQGKFTTPDGRPRAEIVGAAIGALVGVAILVWRSRRRD